MARSHGRIYVDIWQDDDFRALRPSEQRLYLFLISQPNLSHLGVLPLTYRRWRPACEAYSTDELHDDLAALHEARFIVVDEDAEEVLVRSLFRRDLVWRSPNVLRSAVSAASAVHSAVIRKTLLEEIARVDVTELSEEPGRNGQSPREVVAGLLRTLEDILAVPIGDGSENPSPNPSRKGFGNGTETTDTRAFPPSTIHHPSPSTRTRAAQPDGFAEFWQTYPRRVGKASAVKAYRKALKSGATHEQLVEGARRYRQEREGQDVTFTAHASSWLNAGRWEDEPPAPAEQSWAARRGLA